MALRRTVSNTVEAQKASRKIVEKFHDLRQGKKLDRLYDQVAGPNLLLIVCIGSLRSFIDCCFSDLTDVRIEQLKNALLGKFDRLHDEIVKASQARATVAASFIVDVIKAHNDLFELLHRERIRFDPCGDEWLQTYQVAREIWGEGVR